MKRIKAKKLLQFTTDQLWLNLKGNFILTFDDGEIKTNSKETIYSSYCWDMHRRYPDTPMLLSHHLQTYTAKKRAGTDTHLSLINSILWTVFDYHQHQYNDKTDLIDNLAKQAYEISNCIYNSLTYRLEEYVTSLDIVDFIQITRDSNVKNSMDLMPPTQDGIDSTYTLIKDTMKNKPELKANPLVNAINSGLASHGQALQCVGPRGFLTDIDSSVFKNPIKRGFVQGIRSAHDMIIETRSAAKSIIFATDPLQQSEYFSRRQQFICQNVRHLHHGDCGSQSYLDWRVRDARYSNNMDDYTIDVGDKYDEDGNEVQLTNRFNSDLNTIVGKYYLDESTGKLKVVKKTDTHLLNTTIKLRSVIAGCSHPDPYGICEVCYGEGALSVPKNANIGHLACVTMTAVVGQNILSTKHYDGSSVVEGIVLRQEEKKYLSAPINGSLYYLSETLKNKKIEIIIEPSNARGLTDIRLVDDLEKFSLARLSELEKLHLRITSAKEEEIIALNVSINGRLSSMTYDLLRHIKKVGWAIDDKNQYIIDLTGWNFKLPILVLPIRHFNTSSHQGTRYIITLRRYLMLLLISKFASLNSNV